jgi:hypothetical protein
MAELGAGVNPSINFPNLYFPQEFELRADSLNQLEACPFQKFGHNPFGVFAGVGACGKMMDEFHGFQTVKPVVESLF